MHWKDAVNKIVDFCNKKVDFFLSGWYFSFILYKQLSGCTMFRKAQIPFWKCERIHREKVSYLSLFPFQHITLRLTSWENQTAFALTFLRSHSFSAPLWFCVTCSTVNDSYLNVYEPWGYCSSNLCLYICVLCMMVLGHTHIYIIHPVFAEILWQDNNRAW